MVKYFVLIPLSLIISVSSFADILKLKKFKDENVAIHYEGPLKKAAERVAEIYPLIKSDLERKLRLSVGFKPTIILIHRASRFEKMVKAGKITTAFAVPQSNTIVVDYSKMERTPFSLELTLKHELCHLMLHQYIRNDLLPKWLNEGLAQWVSEGMADIINFNNKKILKKAVLTKSYLPLKAIERSFPTSQNLLFLSYEESRSFVEYIDETYGSDKLLLILKKLHDGNNIEKAVFESLSVDLKELEYEWQSYLRRKYTWYSYLADNIYWIIFFVAALVTLIGYLRLRIRMKTYFRDEEDDEYY